MAPPAASPNLPTLKREYCLPLWNQVLRGEVETIAGALEEKTQACLAAEARVEKLEGALAKEIASYETQAERTTLPLPFGTFFFHTTNI